MNLLSEKEEALRLTFGLIVRMFAYEDALDDLRLAAQQEPSCLEFFAPQVRKALVRYAGATVVVVGYRRLTLQGRK